MPIILKNNASSPLTTSISASDTGLVVVDGSQFPVLTSGDYFYATLVSPAGTTEIVKVTARVSNSLTVVRAQDGSSAASFAAGALLEMRVNAASVVDLVGEHDEAAEISIADAGGYYTSDNVEGALQEAMTRTNLAASAGSSLVGYNQGGSGAVNRTVQSRLRDFVSTKDFGITGDVLIPTHFPTLQSAIDMFGPNRPDKIVLRIEAGHFLTSGIYVEDGDFSSYTVVSDDPVVYLSPFFPGTDIFYCRNGGAPTLGCKIDALDLSADGYALYDNSKGTVLSNCGIDNAGGRGLYVTGNSEVFARGCVFNNNGSLGFWITRNSKADLELSTFNGNKKTATTVNSNSVRRSSRVNAEGITIHDSVGVGLTITRTSHMNASGASILRSGNAGIVVDRASSLSLEGTAGPSFVNDNNGAGITAISGSIIAATGVTATGNVIDLRTFGGIIYADGGTITSGPSKSVYNSLAFADSSGVGSTTGYVIDVTGMGTCWSRVTVDFSSSAAQTFAFPAGFQFSNANLVERTITAGSFPSAAVKTALVSTTVVGDDLSWRVDVNSPVVGAGTRDVVLFARGPIL